MVERLVVDVAGNVLLFEATDAVLEPRSAGNRPRTRESFGIALVGQVAVRTVGFRCKLDREGGNFVDVGNPPGLGAVRKIAIRKNDHGNHVLNGDAAGFERSPKAITGR